MTQLFKEMELLNERIERRLLYETATYEPRPTHKQTNIKYALIILSLVAGIIGMAVICQVYC